MKKLIKQAIAFVGLSGIGWILDFGAYTGLGVVSDNLMVNNAISSWVGVTFVFIFANRKVFNHIGRIPLKWKYIAYLLYQCILIFFISKLLNTINIAIVTNIKTQWIWRFSAIISKILVTPFTMMLNFLVMKGIVEKM